MAVHASIPQFPAEINREYFGAWLAGFTAGEGSFILKYSLVKNKASSKGHRSVNAAFRIGLRADDSAALDLIRQFFQAGYFAMNVRGVHKVTGYYHHPIKHFIIDNPGTLAKVVVPFFDAHPLIAKKARDYEIWKKAVKLLAFNRTRGERQRIKQELNYLMTAIREQRRYDAPAITKLAHEEPPLFDLCS